MALFYEAAPSSRISAIGRTDTLAQEMVPDNWTTSEKGYFARYADIVVLRQPFTLQSIRTRFPTWARWNNLFGVRVHIVPEEYHQPLAEIIAGDNPSARVHLSPWLIYKDLRRTVDQRLEEEEYAKNKKSERPGNRAEKAALKKRAASKKRR